MRSPLHYAFIRPDGSTVEGDGMGVVSADTLSIHGSGRTLDFALRDMVSISGANHRISIALAPSGSLHLSQLGFNYIDFQRALATMRNELALGDLLMVERPRAPGVPGEHRVMDAEGRERGRGGCEIRLYQTGLVILPENGEVLRVPYAEIAEVSGGGYVLELILGSGGKLSLSMLGREREPLRKGITDAVSELMDSAQRLLKDVHPSADAISIHGAAALIKDGRAVGQAEAEAACRGLWPALERRVAGLGLGEEYAYLKEMAGDGIRIGMKRPLRGEGDYVWVLAPIYGHKDKGSAVAMEATAEEDEGRATYLFRIVGRDEHAGLDAPAMRARAEEFMTTLNECMIRVNFRREPIYLPEERLDEPRYSRYRHSIMRLPELRMLRERFMGRVVHSSLEQWRAGIDELLALSARTMDDGERAPKLDDRIRPLSDREG